ncbi:hypothetical protein EV360DRAFT_71875 [Lentinula raphanica]|nr:hypothetical protein EV360DRAFT_71875 [Lentinula raphanica]
MSSVVHASEFKSLPRTSNHTPVVALLSLSFCEGFDGYLNSNFTEPSKWNEILRGRMMEGCEKELGRRYSWAESSNTRPFLSVPLDAYFQYDPARHAEPALLWRYSKRFRQSTETYSDLRGTVSTVSAPMSCSTLHTLDGWREDDSTKHEGYPSIALPCKLISGVQKFIRVRGTFLAHGQEQQAEAKTGKSNRGFLKRAVLNSRKTLQNFSNKLDDMNIASCASLVSIILTCIRQNVHGGLSDDDLELELKTTLVGTWKAWLFYPSSKFASIVKSPT